MGSEDVYKRQAWHRMVLHGIALHLMILHSLACHCIVSYGVAGYCIVGFCARAVSRKTPTYFISSEGALYVMMTYDIDRYTATF